MLEVKHRRLKTGLSSCTEWAEFEGYSSTSRTLGGFGNLEDNILHFPDGSFRAVALGSLNKETKQRRVNQGSFQMKFSHKM